MLEDFDAGSFSLSRPAPSVNLHTQDAVCVGYFGRFDGLCSSYSLRLRFGELAIRNSVMTAELRFAVVFQHQVTDRLLIYL